MMDRMLVVVEEGGFAPERAHSWDAGLDLRTPVDITILPGKRVCVDTLVRVEIPKHAVGFVKSKSGLMVKKGILTDGTVDAGYTGTVGVCLFNTSDETVVFNRGDKIAQLVVMDILLPKPVLTDSLYDTERGEGGFGSTGR